MKKLNSFLLILFLLSSACSLKNDKINNLDLESCSNAGGHWNECGSPCLGTGAEYCIEVCEEHCECGGIAGFNCPGSYKCRLTGKIADELGVCIKE